METFQFLIHEAAELMIQKVRIYFFVSAMFYKFIKMHCLSICYVCEIVCLCYNLQNGTVSQVENATAHSSADKTSDDDGDDDPELMPVFQAETTEEGMYVHNVVKHLSILFCC